MASNRLNTVVAGEPSRQIDLASFGPTLSKVFTDWSKKFIMTGTVE
jgi:hypothetical protein